MGTKYKRIKNFEELIHSAKLPYHAWKVIFIVEGEVSAGQIAEFLDEDEKTVEESLNRLQKEGLLEAVTDEQVDIRVEEEEQQLPIAFEEETEKVDESGSAEEESFEFEPIESGTEPAAVDELSEFDLSESMPDELPEEDLSNLSLEEESLPPVAEEEQVPEDFSLEKEFEPEFAQEEAAIADMISEDAGSMEETLDEVIDEQEDIDIQIAATEEKTGQVSSEADLDLDFNIPLTPETVEAPPLGPPPVKKEAKEVKTGAKSVLVVDDSIVIRKMVEIALEDENFNIYTAVSGKDGLAVLDDKNPDLLILDLMLPDINGIDMLKTVKASKGIPVIMLSGKDSPQMVEKARAEGADAFLPKPFKDDELIHKIKELLA